MSFLKCRAPVAEPDFPCQPPMTPFKQFLASQDDSISEEDAVKKYNHYKLEFKKTQLNEYFLAHKNEEWYASLITNPATYCGGLLD